MPNEEWSGDRVAAALARLEGAGYPQSRMARLAGVSPSTINRWGRGRVRPGYDAARRLAAATWHRHPAEARELVEASGYAWSQPSAPPPEPLVAPELAAELRRRHPEDAEYVIAELERRRAERLGEPRGGQAS